MSCTWQIARLSFLSMIRTRFFWVWNLATIFLTLALPRITYFDFEGDSLSELFLSTLILNGAVNALVFHLSSGKESARKDHDLLFTRPIGPLAIAGGLLLGTMAYQLLVFVFLITTYLVQAWSLGLSLHPADPISWAFAFSKIAMLSAFFGLTSAWLSGFWASVVMIAVYLIGHLSAAIHASIPQDFSIAASALFCLVPDLASSALGGDRGGAVHDRLMILWESLYIVAYLGFILGIGAISLPAARNRQ